MAARRETGEGETGGEIEAGCRRLGAAGTRGELGSLIARLVLSFPPGDLRRMIGSFSLRIADVEPGYRSRVTEKISEHLLGTYQRIRLMDQQGAFSHMDEPLGASACGFWDMVTRECRGDQGGGEPRLRFLKYLLAGFTMFVLGGPAHAVGTPFPGGDAVQLLDGVYTCPVREKANDVGGALCPFCPAVQTPAIGYLKPPVNGSEHRKQEFLRTTYDHHHFNG
ncbi:MAG: DUF2115 domain-containing protein [Methanomicrobiales archaeon]|nr:DUF2115 domain-containing protein [Methanomicrobiales archaeon]